MKLQKKKERYSCQLLNLTEVIKKQSLTIGPQEKTFLEVMTVLMIAVITYTYLI